VVPEKVEKARGGKCLEKKGIGQQRAWTTGDTETQVLDQHGPEPNSWGGTCPEARAPS